MGCMSKTIVLLDKLYPLQRVSRLRARRPILSVSWCISLKQQESESKARPPLEKGMKEIDVESELGIRSGERDSDQDLNLVMG
ncbi:hypothetical protein EVAR_100420_1 [Eumeta japonica]|uniref:Uncharacterized protein n=1 Tax=Eumeta variegata TaxID=151549 RepID=A0A4C1SNF0_EUMVA|nr:hypothetical protein EVAR_100420_1 [Eumeta japonica]